jgi:hypothetical protein
MVVVVLVVAVVVVILVVFLFMAGLAVAVVEMPLVQLQQTLVVTHNMVEEVAVVRLTL